MQIQPVEHEKPFVTTVTSPCADFCVVAVGFDVDTWHDLYDLWAQLLAEGDVALLLVPCPPLPDELRVQAAWNLPIPLKVLDHRRSLPVQPNHAYLVGSGDCVVAGDDALSLAAGDPVTNPIAPIDHLFRSLAETQRANAIAITLFGTGAHGVLGLADIHAAGGLAICQEPSDPALVSEAARSDAAAYLSQVSSRPGLPDATWSLAEIPERLAAYRSTAPRLPEVNDRPSSEDKQWSQVQAILADVFAATGCDFTGYQAPHLLAPLRRRMRIQSIVDLAAYQDSLRGSLEAVKLGDDLLPSGMQFFPSGAAHVAMEHEIIPQIFAHKSPADEIRVWVEGCATGEEAYSVAMLLAREQERRHNAPRIRIFASDQNERRIRMARKGQYVETIAADVPRWALERYFQPWGEGLQVRGELRQQMTFARHNVLADPPFGRLDLLVCRHLLGRLEPPFRDQVRGRFHFALQEGGILVVGAEGEFSAGDSFEPTGHDGRAFRRLQGHAGLKQSTSGGRLRASQVKWPDNVELRPKTGELFEQLLGAHEEPAVLIDGEYNIVYLGAHTARYLSPTPGAPIHNLLKQVRPAARPVLIAALVRAQAEKKPVVSEPIEMSVDGMSQTIRLEVLPAVQTEWPGYALVIFEPVPVEEQRAVAAGDLKEQLKTVERELEEAKQQLQITVEQFQVANEELRSANEELRMLAEELTSAMEELEIGSERQAATNAELAETNQELHRRIEQTERLSGDLTNLLLAGDIATVFLDRYLCLRWFTPQAKKVINLIDADIGRPLAHVTTTLDYPGLHEDVAEVHRTLLPRQGEARSGNHWYLVQINPYRRADEHIDGIVVSFVDITSQKQAAEAMRQSEERLRMATEAGRVAIFDYDIAEDSAICSPIFYQITQLDPATPLTLAAATNIVQDEDRTRLKGEIQNLIAAGQSATLELRLCCPDGTTRWVECSVLVVRDDQGQPVRLMGTMRDVTERKDTEAALREWNALLERRVAERTSELERSNRELDQFARIASHDLKAPLRAIGQLATWIREDAGPVLPGPSKGHLEKLGSRVKRMDILLDDLLEYSRAARRLQPPRKVDTAALVRDVAELLAVPGFTITVDEPMPIILAEPVPLETIFRNLIGNAIKHHPHPDRGNVRISAAQQDAWVEFAVADDGDGIPPEFHERIFQVFQRLNPQSNVEGSGMGLAVVKKIVESRGGNVTLESSPGHGATFRFSWPLQGDTQTAADNPPLF
jgi:two-component system, chemotaxis family, CheB/CheR fusion protein